MREAHTWDVFCRVVDHFGDAGVCWRLARQLVSEHRAHVRLWIDDLQSLMRLHPGFHALEQQRVDDVDVYRWGERFTHVQPGDIVVEAFGCGLPDEYVSAMAQGRRRPVWIVLEYLSAESWVVEHHGRPSPHPRLPLERYFFFPGFVPGTGGVLREADLFERRDRYDVAQRDVFWRSLTFEPPAPDALTVSIYAYEHAPLADLLHCWERGERQVVVAVPEAPIWRLVLQHFGTVEAPSNRALARGALEVRLLPFVPQARYDELLWACDCNFVRGEDSFVRAQWATHPFVWHVYPQAEHAHWRKLEAFLTLYAQGLSPRACEAAGNFMRVWNQSEGPEVTIASAWQAFSAELDVLRHWGREWAGRIGDVGSLTANLARFCLGKLK
ncbi:MAG TPA: elongation factor P maturation arginine rhamnosyltransferase EarP [Burkholderiales bacterium]|nr:elongation factor P maturation arginine rhamnosyltransferase EarP [Burkholderiales bacterium]